MEEIPRPKKKRFYMFRELFSFMRMKRKWWLLPVFIMIIVAALIIIFGQSSAISPFIYALF
ncbi:MAG TPA: DUF5989 family protein [archaeon]|nr:DUF5989 family protein [archaeon]